MGSDQNSNVATISRLRVQGSRHRVGHCAGGVDFSQEGQRHILNQEANSSARRQAPSRPSSQGETSQALSLLGVAHAFALPVIVVRIGRESSVVECSVLLGFGDLW